MITYDNYYKLLHALKQMGRDVVEFENEETLNPKTSFFRYTLDLCTIDLLPSLKSGLAFRRCFVNRKVAYFDQVEISFLGLDDLITDKMHDARPKDLDEVKHIKKDR